MKVQNTILIILFCGIVSITQAWAQSEEVISMSIQDCIDFAKTNNSNIEIAKYDQEIALQQTREVRGRGLPQVNINGSYTDNLKLGQSVLDADGFPGAEGGEPIVITFGLQYNTLLTGEATQMLYDPSFWVGLKAAKSSAQLYQQQTQQVTEETAYNIASAYYRVIVVQKQLQLYKDNLENTRKTLSNTELQFKNGVAKQVDVNRLRVNASNLESQVRQSELSFAQSMNNLKFQMGMPLTETIMLTDTALTFSQDEVVLKEAQQDVYNNRLDYKILLTNLEIQELDRKNNSSGYFPTLTAFANYGYAGQGPQFGIAPTPNNDWFDYTTAAIGLRLNIPVFDGLQRSARVQQSKLKINQINEQLDLTKLSIDLDISNARTQYLSTLQRIDAEQQNVDLAQEVYEVTQLEFREGVGTSTDVVEAETSLRQAQNTYINTLLDLYTARLDMEKAKGNLLTYINNI